MAETRSDTNVITHPRTIRRATTPDEIATCLSIRAAVFTLEQGVPPELELDELDAEAIHYLGYEGEAPLATGRVRLIGDVAKVQRVAVLAAARGTGLGAQLMRHVVDDLRKCSGARRVTLGSQETAVGFYERLGFAKHGERFMDAGIPHFEMRLDL